MLNLGQLMGAGIYSVPGSILKSVGSIGLLLTFWILGSIFAFGVCFFEHPICEGC